MPEATLMAATIHNTHTAIYRTNLTYLLCKQIKSNVVSKIDKCSPKVGQLFHANLYMEQKIYIE